jgi:hypothetical protein
VLDAVIAATWKTPHEASYAGEIGRVVDDVALYELMALATNDRPRSEYAR